MTEWRSWMKSYLVDVDEFVCHQKHLCQLAFFGAHVGLVAQMFLDKCLIRLWGRAVLHRTHEQFLHTWSNLTHNLFEQFERKSKLSNTTDWGSLILDPWSMTNDQGRRMKKEGSTRSMINDQWSRVNNRSRIMDYLDDVPSAQLQDGDGQHVLAHRALHIVRCE